MKSTSTIRRALLAGTLSIVGITAAMVPAPVHAAGTAAPQRGRQADPIADQAVRALFLLNQSIASGDSAARVSYEQERNSIADGIASRLGIDASPLRTAWAKADIEHQQALIGAFTQLGVPYRKNTSKAGIGFDCSGITTYAWAQAGITLQRSSSAQIRAAVPLTPETAQAGDLVQYPGHVMMWLGVDRAIVHSPQPGHNVEVDVISNNKKLRFGDPTP